MKDGRFQTLPLVEDRQCGECRLCCKLLAVGKPGEDFQKAAGKWCEHACSTGCAIQETKPEVCTEYQCIWLRGIFADRDRPERSKIVVSLEYADGPTYTEDGRVIAGSDAVWCVYESIPGVTLRGRAKAIVAELENMVITDESGQRQGPFPICIIRSTSQIRIIKYPDSDRWIPVLRPGEVDPFTGKADTTLHQREIKHDGD